MPTSDPTKPFPTISKESAKRSGTTVDATLRARESGLSVMKPAVLANEEEPGRLPPMNPVQSFCGPHLAQPGLPDRPLRVLAAARTRLPHFCVRVPEHSEGGRGRPGSTNRDHAARRGPCVTTADSLGSSTRRLRVLRLLPRRVPRLLPSECGSLLRPPPGLPRSSVPTLRGRRSASPRRLP